MDTVTPTRQRVTMDHRVLKVIALMRDYLHRGWPASKLAQFVNISPSRLHQLFKSETGVPPAKYLHLLRMERSRELLETSYLSIKEVMRQVGVPDASHFVRDFKKRYGSTPARYRKSFRNSLHQEAAPDKGSIPNPAPKPFNPFFALKRPLQISYTSPVASGAAPPLLLRRASHPRHLAEDSSPFLRAKKKQRDLLSLLYLRHLAFAELSNNITFNLARGISKVRSIFYRPRRSVLSRRLPPAAERPRVP